MIKIYNAGNIIEAHIIHGMLEANGIEAYVGGHFLQGGIGELTTMDFATIHVIDEHAGPARRIINEYEKCQAPAGAQADYTSRSPGAWLKVVLLFAALVLLLMIFLQ